MQTFIDKLHADWKNKEEEKKRRYQELQDDELSGGEHDEDHERKKLHKKTSDKFQRVKLHHNTKLELVLDGCSNKGPLTLNTHLKEEEEVFSMSPEKKRPKTRLGNITYGNIMHKSQIHAKANVVGMINEESKQKCECCGRPAEVVPIPLTTKNNKLGFLGAAYPMYFDWVKRCCYLLLILFLSEGLHNLAINYHGSRCVEPLPPPPPPNSSNSTNNTQESSDYSQEMDDIFPCLKNYVTQMSLGNSLAFNRLVERNLIWFLTQVILMGYMARLKFKITRNSAKIDIENISPNDYSVMIFGLPVLKTAEEIRQLKAKVKDFFNNKDDLSSELKVEKIGLIYRQDLETKELIRPKETTGWAIITFDRTYMARAVLKSYAEENSIFNRVRFLFRPMRSKFFFEGRILRVKPAPDPTDLVFIAYSYDKWATFWRRRKTDAVAVILFVVLVCLLFFLQLADNNDKTVNGRIDFKTKLFTNPIKFYWFVGLIAGLMVGLQVGCEYIIGLMIKMEMHKTKTSHEIYYTKRIVFYRTVNQIIMPFVVQMWFGQNTLFLPFGYVNSQFSIFMAMIVLDPVLFFILDIASLWKRSKHRKALELLDHERRENGLTMFDEVSDKMRKEFFKLSEKRGFPLGDRYVNAIGIIFSSCILSSIQPIFLLFGLLSLMANYWMEKYILLRRCKMPKSLGTRLPIAVADSLSYLLVLCLIVQYILLFKVYDPLRTPVPTDCPMNSTWTADMNLTYINEHNGTNCTFDTMMLGFNGTSVEAIKSIAKEEKSNWDWALMITNVAAIMTALYVLFHRQAIVYLCCRQDFLNFNYKKEPPPYSEVSKKSMWQEDYDRVNPASRNRVLDKIFGKTREVVEFKRPTITMRKSQKMRTFIQGSSFQRDFHRKVASTFYRVFFPDGISKILEEEEETTELVNQQSQEQPQLGQDSAPRRRRTRRRLDQQASTEGLE